jgi:hypothetical protein
MSVVARMYVAQITEYAHGQGAKEVTLQAVSRGPENKQWAAATPSGRIVMTINNGAAAAAFLVGKEYLVTFDVAPDPAEKPLTNAYGS